MKNCYFILFLLSCLCPRCALAGDKNYTLPNGTMKLFIEPAALIDLVNDPSIRLGIEAPVYKHFSAFVVGGIYSSGNYGKAGVKFYGFSKKDPELFFALSASYKPRLRIRQNKRILKFF